MTYEQLFRTLQAEGFRADAAAPSLPGQTAPTPWVARVLLGVCGWIAGLFVCLALGAIFSGLFANAGALTVIAVVGLSAAAAVYARAGRNELVLQFALATSMAGQLAAAAAMSHWLPQSTALVALSMAVLQALLVAIMRNPLHRFLSALFAVAALGVTAREWHALPLFAALVAVATVGVWLGEARWRRAGMAEIGRPVGYALAIALLFIPIADPYWLFLPSRPAAAGADWLTALALLPALALLLWWLTGSAGLARQAAAAVAGVSLVVLAAYAPGITLALLVMLLAFRVGSRLLLGAALLAAVTYMGIFYYQLHTTLLVKSIALLVAGAGCWIARTAMHWLPQGESR
jgi:uncharacterized membrane protein